MNPAQQTAMDIYGFTEWPESWERTRVAADARSQACWILKREGVSLSETAKILGFHGATSVRDSLARMKGINNEC